MWDTNFSLFLVNTFCSVGRDQASSPHPLGLLGKRKIEKIGGVGKRPYSGSSPSSHASTHVASGIPAEVASAGR
jgi:hypothetical protein